MESRRLQLQSILETILGTDRVYFQPPTNVQMQYPCIVYERSDAQTRFADDNPYSYIRRYKVTVIDRDPDSDIPEKVAALPKCLHNAFFTADNLNHDVFNLYF